MFLGPIKLTFLLSAANPARFVTQMSIFWNTNKQQPSNILLSDKILCPKKLATTSELEVVQRNLKTRSISIQQKWTSQILPSSVLTSAFLHKHKYLYLRIKILIIESDNDLWFKQSFALCFFYFYGMGHTHWQFHLTLTTYGGSRYIYVFLYRRRLPPESALTAQYSASQW